MPTREQLPDPAALPSRAECIRQAGEIAASGCSELHEIWLAEGRAGVARASGEQAAAKYEGWVDGNRRKRAQGSAA